MEITGTNKRCGYKSIRGCRHRGALFPFISVLEAGFMGNLLTPMK